MASIPARARKLAAHLTKLGVQFEYTPATSPGESHEFHLKTSRHKPFTVLVERSQVTVWDPNGTDSRAYPDEANALQAILTLRNIR